ncbi:hypothetical protein [Sphingobacterium cellulitidis]|uniref:hypothetical protein n=1 Tax=Sphingobacterium cellulitidis TaxID=1768011 RepID=UPI00146E1E13
MNIRDLGGFSTVQMARSTGLFPQLRRTFFGSPSNFCGQAPTEVRRSSERILNSN